jgi:ABC-2 type transport system permease protein
MKSVSLLWSFAKVSAIADLEYRLNVVVKILTDIFWYAAQLALFEVLFRHVNDISGWSIDTIRVFMGILFMVDAIYMFFFSENLDRLSESVSRGDLDLLLTKPVDSQFMISLRKISTPYLINLTLAASWTIWSVNRAAIELDGARVLAVVVLVACGVLITYSCRFFFSAMALIFTRAENLNYVWYQLYRLATRPDSIYPSWVRFAILTFLPMGFIASVPARALIEGPTLVWLAGGVLLAGLALGATRVFWRFGLRRYSSASS